MGTRQTQPPYTYDFAKVDDKVPMVEFLRVIFPEACFVPCCFRYPVACCGVVHFLDSLNVRERAKVFASIEKLIELKNAGLNPKENLSKHLTDGIFEMRVSFKTELPGRSFFIRQIVRSYFRMAL